MKGVQCPPCKWAWIGAMVFALDQATKWWIVSRLDLHSSLSIIPGFFNLTYVRNAGAAWGILKGYPGALTWLAGITLTVLLFFGAFFSGHSRWTRCGWALLIGGISGNLADRIRLGNVVDFLDFYVRAHHWPAFNVADSAICIGVCCYLIDSLLKKREAPSS